MQQLEQKKIRTHKSIRVSQKDGPDTTIGLQVTLFQTAAQALGSEQAVSRLVKDASRAYDNLRGKTTSRSEFCATLLAETIGRNSLAGVAA
ncbi:hypothetical protein F6X40_35470 [Paraburkholderia sp. UCT31]|uniref:hypothetical protein n=1 Tax=Paraburkholderia sp. UCT31 TaxID=2615209 RepID=UPI001655BAE0|nr:hypothetical protein [Paraburkholderia sp. UCT31]MBC8741850.1 hypothetical protein [Paraburkholderia sp. UCT31]